MVLARRTRGSWLIEEDGTIAPRIPEEPEESFAEKADRILRMMIEHRDEEDTKAPGLYA